MCDILNFHGQNNYLKFRDENRTCIIFHGREEYFFLNNLSPRNTTNFNTRKKGKRRSQLHVLYDGNVKKHFNMKSITYNGVSLVVKFLGIVHFFFLLYHTIS